MSALQRLRADFRGGASGGARGPGFNRVRAGEVDSRAVPATSPAPPALGWSHDPGLQAAWREAGRPPGRGSLGRWTGRREDPGARAAVRRHPPQEAGPAAATPLRAPLGSGSGAADSSALPGGAGLRR